MVKNAYESTSINTLKDWFQNQVLEFFGGYADVKGVVYNI